MLDPDVYTSFEGFLWTPWLTIFHQCLTDLKEQVPIPAFTIGKDTQLMSLSRDLVQCLSRLLKEFAILLATIERPNESTGSLHEQYGPPA